MVIKIEVSAEGHHLHCIVTNMKHATATALYQQFYCPRGNCELNIKEHKLYLKSDRISCHRFGANQFRVFLHSAAYVLIHALRTNVLKHTQWAQATIETIRLKIFKIGACIRELKTRIKIVLPSSYPLKDTLLKSFLFFKALTVT